MSDAPIRVQLSRAKGWRMPPNTIKVCRPGPFGNPFTIADAVDIGVKPDRAQAFVARCFRYWLAGDRSNWMGDESDKAAATILAREARDD